MLEPTNTTQSAMNCSTNVTHPHKDEEYHQLSLLHQYPLHETWTKYGPKRDAMYAPTKPLEGMLKTYTSRQAHTFHNKQACTLTLCWACIPPWDSPPDPRCHSSMCTSHSSCKSIQGTHVTCRCTVEEAPRHKCTHNPSHGHAQGYNPN